MRSITTLSCPRSPRWTQDDAFAWRRHADALAAWAAGRLVNRSDVWGGYLPLRYRVPGQSKSVTRPRRNLRGQHFLTPNLLAAHFRGHDCGDVLGTHSTSTANTSLWGLIDLDAHGPGADPAANERAATYWYGRLKDCGFNPLLTTSDERGGLHLRVLLDRPAPTPRVHAFLHDLVSDHRRQGIVDVEVFPKQPRLEPGAFGNWARIPGRHHTRPVWPLVWRRDGWVGGEEAVQIVLASRGDSPTLIPPQIVAPPPRHAAGVVITNLPDRTLGPTHANTRRGSRMSDAQIAQACLQCIDNSVGGGRHYNEWIAVGMVLHDIEPSAAMLAEWIAWSRRSSKHVEGACEAKWPTFGRRSGWTLGSLVKWARDGGAQIFPTSNGGGRAA